MSYVLCWVKFYWWNEEKEVILHHNPHPYNTLLEKDTTHKVKQKLYIMLPICRHIKYNKTTIVCILLAIFFDKIKYTFDWRFISLYNRPTTSLHSFFFIPEQVMWVIHTKRRVHSNICVEMALSFLIKMVLEIWKVS